MGNPWARCSSMPGSLATRTKPSTSCTQGQVDLVIVEPGDAVSTIKNNQQAVFTLYHHEIDPVQVSYINYLGWLYVGAVNQQVLRSFAVQGQKDAVNLHTNLQEAHQNVSAMRQAVQSGDEALAQQKQQGLASNVDAVSLAVGASLGLLDSLQQTKAHKRRKRRPGAEHARRPAPKHQPAWQQHRHQG